MPKNTSKTATATATKTEQVVAPVVDSSAPVAEKKTKKPKVAKEPVAPVPAPEPVVVAEQTTVSDSEAPHLEQSLTEQSVDFLANLQQLSVAISTLKTEYRALEKKWTREVKAAQKASSKRKRKSGNRAPSGFVKPAKISDELAKFLDKPLGSEMARTDVTKQINEYVVAHNLKNPTNGRHILPDAKLAALLKLTSEDKLTYFNLQKYMCIHFPKQAKVEA